MMEIDNILQHLFKKNAIGEASLPELKELVETYPYFAAGHLLYSIKLNEEKDEAARQQHQKTNLYFHDTLWLEWLLAHSATKDGNTEAAAKRPGAEIPAPVAQQSHIAEENTAKTEIPASVAQQSHIAEEDTAGTETPVTSGELPSRAVKEDPGQAEMPASTASPSQTTEGPGELQPSEAKSTVLPAFREMKLTTANHELTFDPFHTIDYFGSLGIKLGKEINPGDKLGLQLKSFTDWLKTMRQLPKTSVLEESLSGGQQQGDAKIEQLAARSLVDKEVLTEAMAEVLIMQDKRDKAAEVYSKLSLLNPDKSAYFATKIEELKQH